MTKFVNSIKQVSIRPSSKIDMSSLNSNASLRFILVYFYILAYYAFNYKYLLPIATCHNAGCVLYINVHTCRHSNRQEIFQCFYFLQISSTTLWLGTYSRVHLLFCSRPFIFHNFTWNFCDMVGLDIRLYKPIKIVNCGLLLLYLKFIRIKTVYSFK